MATTELLRFALLPFELRHDIWESHLPKDNDPAVQALIHHLANRILKMPRDRLSSDGSLGRYVHIRTKSDSAIDASAYASLLGCTESRVVALKDIRKLLLQRKDMKRWFKKREFQRYFPTLELDKFNGALIYTCNGITEPAGYHLEHVFWEPTSPPAPSPSSSPASVTEEMKEIPVPEVKEEKSEKKGGVEVKDETEEVHSVTESTKRKREPQEGDKFSKGEPDIDPASFQPLGEGVTWFDESDDEDDEPSPKRQKHE
ncbi:uncharacterized protein PAC_04751 [Phialocephala subalpina]|uniref:2EXR domain-containing protein n=1 Tax=Phialocephala subalpina TaxID=576137 RepID=A0A1L7WQ19_9HELO|nr:uncharacterized protein PAC_04751 [Phialocephala subalpina]